MPFICLSVVPVRVCADLRRVFHVVGVTEWAQFASACQAQIAGSETYSRINWRYIAVSYRKAKSPERGVGGCIVTAENCSIAERTAQEMEVG